MTFMVEEEAEAEITLPASYEQQAITIATVVSNANTSGTLRAKNEGGTTVSNVLNLGTIGNACKFFNSQGGSNVEVGIRIPKETLAAGAQKIKVVFAGCPAGHTAKCWVDWWGIEATEPPLILLENALRLAETGYELEQSANRFEKLTDAGVAQIQTVNANVAAAYTDGLVRVVEADDLINKGAAYFLKEPTVQGVHPSTEGATVIAKRALTQVTGNSPESASGQITFGGRASPLEVPAKPKGELHLGHKHPHVRTGVAG